MKNKENKLFNALKKFYLFKYYLCKKIIPEK